MVAFRVVACCFVVLCLVLDRAAAQQESGSDDSKLDLDPSTWIPRDSSWVAPSHWEPKAAIQTPPNKNDPRPSETEPKASEDKVPGWPRTAMPHTAMLQLAGGKTVKAIADPARRATRLAANQVLGLKVWA